MPKRIQRKRTKGWRMPEGARSVTRPSRWGNPFRAGHSMRGDMIPPYVYNELEGKYFRTPKSTEEAVALFASYARSRIYHEQWRRDVAEDWLAPLRGMDLACYCPTDAEHCHADVLLDLANREPSDPS